jgi:Protein of unknown function (DUF4019)
MNRLIAIVLATFTFVSAPAGAAAQDAEMVASAQAASQAWLALTDSGAYSESWTQSAGAFQAAVSRSSWVSAIQGVRSPLGGLKSRTVKSATFTRSLPNAPAGEYVVIQYETQFEHKANATETVTPLREKDGSWKVSGYFIK